MRTTLNLDDALYRRVKVKAAQDGRTVTDLIEEGLRLALEGGRAALSGRTKKRSLPVISCKHPAVAGAELTPEAVAELLLQQETGWHHEAAR